MENLDLDPAAVEVVIRRRLKERAARAETGVVLGAATLQRWAAEEFRYIVDKERAARVLELN